MPSISRENARIWLLLTIFFLTILSRNDGPALITGPFMGASRLGRLRDAHRVLNSTKWGDFDPHEAVEDAPPWQAPRFLNLTGFRQTDGYAWVDLPYFRDRCRQWSRHAYPPKDGPDEWDHGPVPKTWQNATGTVHGKWVRRPGSVVRKASGYNLTAIAPGVDWVDSHVEWGWNVTGSHGTILLRLAEDADDAPYEEETEEGQRPRSAGMAREISAVADIQDEANSAPSFAVRLHGVHWPRQGSILLTTTTEKFSGIFGLPHLAPGPDFFQSSQKLLNRTLGEVLRKKERRRFADPSNPWTPVVEEEISVPLPRCEYIMYLQLHPLDPIFIGETGLDDQLVPVVDQLENELRFPTGAPSRGTPDLRMSLVAWSPDCAYYLESKGPPLFPSVEGQHLVGVKSEVLLSRTKAWMFGFAAVLMAQLWLLKTQMKESNTPSTLGRISFQTIAMMLLADGLVFACSSAWSLSATNTFLPSLILTFAAFMSMAIGAGFLSEIHKHQEPERRREQNRTNEANASRTPPAAAPSPAAATSTSPGTLPAPVTTGSAARPSSPPVIIPSDQDIDAEIAENAASGAAALTLPTPRTPPTTTTTTATTTTTPPRPRVSAFASITGTFVTIGIAILILTAMSMAWPPRARAALFHALAFAYLSLWLPQIRRNARRNSRRALAWRFMVGQSALRALPLAYFYLRHDNILFVEPDAVAFAVLVAWLWLQLVVLAVQDVLGPRFGLPRSWAPEVWEYHPVLREDDAEAGGLPIGLVSAASASSSSAGLGGGGAGDSAASSPVAVAAGRRSWSFGDGGGGEGAGEDGAKRREREKELRRHGMALRSIDCAICTEVLEVPVVRANAKDPSAAGGLVGVFARRAYMVTPCRHIFHTKCLEGWFRYKLQCPICREELPPL
ncbi:ba13dfef-1919-464d-83aa-754300ec4b69 [Thermothielavioides terrestris]|uniref:DSC E3 ubiquitin ligase complex subunit A n=1 Tax=Thermothielavioides terrestris TaxID=2587410 RepID=A0A446BH82_9PEZI|nr:ba13dfef-1919-464d-83aa-754300ec4b69 [Thermothielavioides terrestris]